MWEAKVCNKKEEYKEITNWIIMSVMPENAMCSFYPTLYGNTDYILILFLSEWRKTATTVLSTKFDLMVWTFLPMVQLCRRKPWNGSHPLRKCMCVMKCWKVMLTCPCHLREVAITVVTSEQLTSKFFVFLIMYSRYWWLAKRRHEWVSMVTVTVVSAVIPAPTSSN